MQLIIPAYNEANRLPRTLAALRRRLSQTPVPGGLEVVVVDNASDDATAAVARTADCPAMPVRVVHCARRGKGAAVRRGIEVTTHPVVGFMDADGATDLRALTDALRLIDAGADIAIGSRAAPGAVITERHSRLRAWGAGGYRRLARRIVPDVGDTQCGFKVIRGDLARSLFARTRSDGFSFDVELLGRAHRAGARIAEFPVSWVDVPGSTFSPTRHGVNSFASLAAIGWRLRERPAIVTVRDLPVADLPLLAVADA